MMIKKIKILPQKEEVFRILECTKENPIYLQIEEEYEKVILQIETIVTPKAVFGIMELPLHLVTTSFVAREKVIIALLTIGEEGSKLVSSLFEDGNYLAGMTADAILDHYLFQLQRAVQPTLIQLAKEEKKGIARVLEIAEEIDISVQKIIHEKLDAKELLGITINESYMYTPLKTLSQMYLLSEDTKEYHMEHSCNKCRKSMCRYRK